MSRPSTPESAELRHAARRFGAWRGRRTKRVISPELWRLATELAVRCGVSPVARALGLDYYSLKRRSATPRTPQSSPPAFVEIVSSPADAEKECRVEFEDAHGTRMRVTWTARGAPDLDALGRLFLGRPA